VWDLKLDASGVTLENRVISFHPGRGHRLRHHRQQLRREQEAAESSIFKTFPNPEAARQKLYSTKNYFVLLFDESVRGLVPGAPVEFRGIPIGQVIDIKSEFDFKRNKIKIPVIAAVEPERISFIGQLPDGVSRETLVDYLVERGSAPSCARGIFSTASCTSRWILFSDAKPAKLVRGGRYGQSGIPDHPDPVREIGSKVTQLVAKIDKIPIEQIGNDLRDTLQGAKRIANSPELLENRDVLNAAVKELQALTTSSAHTRPPRSRPL